MPRCSGASAAALPRPPPAPPCHAGALPCLFAGEAVALRAAGSQNAWAQGRTSVCSLPRYPANEALAQDMKALALLRCLIRISCNTSPCHRALAHSSRSKLPALCLLKAEPEHCLIDGGGENGLSNFEAFA